MVKQLDGVDLFVAEIQKVKTQYRNQLQEFQQKFTDKPRIEKLQQILARIDVLSSDIEEYKKVVAKLQALDAVISLEGRQPGKITNHTIQEIHSLMETEDKKKDQFQQEASDLKRKLEELSRETPEPKRVEQTAAVAEKAPVIVQVRKQTSSTAVEEDHNILFETTNLTEEQRKKRLRLQMDLELLALKKILQAEQRAKLHPNKISEAMQREKDKLAENLGVVPDWIKKLNAYAMKSRTLRTQIGKAQKNNPDELSFT